MDYKQFLENKTQLSGRFGFKPTFIPDYAFDFQAALIDWSVLKGRGAIFADCGLGKTLIQLAWGENIVRETNGRVLIITPLGVGPQTIREAEKFGMTAARSLEGKLPKEKLVITNYQRLHYFNPNDFEGVVCDESSILKNFDGATRASITEFMRTRKYRLLCTATAAPNDYIELGTSSESIPKSTPLQLDVIERTIVLRSNPDEVVLTPFMGVGSEVYGALVNQRKAIGIELKSSYYRQAVQNAHSALTHAPQIMLDGGE